MAAAAAHPALRAAAHPPAPSSNGDWPSAASISAAAMLSVATPLC